MRTTLDIDAPILKQVKVLQKRSRKSMGRIISDLLSESLKRQQNQDEPPQRSLEWKARPMNARVDLRDRDALYDAMDEDRV